MAFEHEPAGYQVCLHVGPAPTKLLSARCIDLTPAAFSAEAIVDALSASGIQPADLRAKTILSIDADSATAVLAYVAASGFAGRPLHVLIDDQIVDSPALFEAGLRLRQSRPTNVVDSLQVGAERDDMASIALSAPLSEPQATALRWARRLRFVPDPDPTLAVSKFIVILALRSRPQGERYPFLCTGSEPPPSEDTPLESVGVDLDVVRNKALALRRSSHSGERDALADPVEPSARLARLRDAGDLPIEETLARLGARLNHDSGLWHCPRPERHTHGDATASMRVQKGVVRCYVCDPERVDSLRLVMNTLDVTADEAATWLLSDAVRDLPVTVDYVEDRVKEVPDNDSEPPEVTEATS